MQLIAQILRTDWWMPEAGDGGWEKWINESKGTKKKKCS